MRSRAWPFCLALPKRLAYGALVLAGTFSPEGAFAHSSVPGLEGFNVGLVHPLSTPQQLLALLALGLLLGQCWPRKFAVAWLVFALAAVGGLTLGAAGWGHSLAERALLVIAVAASSLATIAPTWVIVPGTVLAGTGGLFLGIVSTPDPGPLRAMIITITGTYVGANLAFFYAIGGVGWLRDRFKKTWAHIGLRIVAAWIAAISCLMLALSVVSRGT